MFAKLVRGREPSRDCVAARHTDVGEPSAHTANYLKSSAKAMPIRSDVPGSLGSAGTGVGDRETEPPSTGLSALVDPDVYLLAAADDVMENRVRKQLADHHRSGKRSVVGRTKLGERCDDVSASSGAGLARRRIIASEAQGDQRCGLHLD
jgi:hypothetical protein